MNETQGMRAAQMPPVAGLPTYALNTVYQQSWSIGKITIEDRPIWIGLEAEGTWCQGKMFGRIEVRIKLMREHAQPRNEKEILEFQADYERFVTVLAPRFITDDMWEKRETMERNQLGEFTMDAMQYALLRHKQVCEYIDGWNARQNIAVPTNALDIAGDIGDPSAN